MDAIRGETRALERNIVRASAARVAIDGEHLTVAQALARPETTLADLQTQGFAIETTPADAGFDTATIQAESNIAAT